MVRIRGMTTKKNSSMMIDFANGKIAIFWAGIFSFSVTIMDQKVPLIIMQMLMITMIPAVYKVLGVRNTSLNTP